MDNTLSVQLMAGNSGMTVTLTKKAIIMKTDLILKKSDSFNSRSILNTSDSRY